jgi:uncharacterized membrane protein
MKKLLLVPAFMIAGALSLANFAAADDYASEAKSGENAKAEKKAPVKKAKKANMKGMEKCYGIAKAGKNDCASGDGKITCAGQAKEDHEENAFLVVPAGMCDRIAGGVKK